MGNINTTTQSGNLCADPEVKVVGNDLTICNLRLAVNRPGTKQDDGSYGEERASFFDIVVFGKFGDLVGRKLQKADSITIQGELVQERWETDEGNRSKVVIHARQIDGAGMYRSKDDETAPASPPPPDVRNESKVATPADDDIPF